MIVQVDAIVSGRWPSVEAAGTIAVTISENVHPALTVRGRINRLVKWDPEYLKYQIETETRNVEE